MPSPQASVLSEAPKTSGEESKEHAAALRSWLFHHLRDGTSRKRRSLPRSEPRAPEKIREAVSQQESAGNVCPTQRLTSMEFRKLSPGMAGCQPCWGPSKGMTCESQHSIQNKPKV